MRTILLSKSDELYLGKCADEHQFAYGIIIGQWAQADKFIVVHLAKNSDEDVMGPIANEPQCVADITMPAMVNQWFSACKMTPGSFDVLGFFVTAMSANLSDETSMNCAKKLFAGINSAVNKDSNGFIANSLLAADNDDLSDNPPSEYLYLTYVNESKKADCFSYTHNTNGGTLTAMNCRFVEKPFEWVGINSNYELDDIFPIHAENTKLNVEQQFMRTVESVRRNLAASVIFLDHENVEDDLSLEAYVKRKRKSTRPTKENQRDAAIFASIFLPVKCHISNGQPFKVRQFNGTIRFAGVISSRIYCNGENTIGDVKRYLRADIIRTLATRIQIYCDALTVPTVSEKAAVIISEPPRRVYFALPTESVKFSEYIFRGEAATVAVAQAKQILDLDVDPHCIEIDAEILGDEDSLDVFGPSGFEGGMMKKNTPVVEPPTPDCPTRSIYITGIAIAIFVLILSVLLQHFIQ